MAEGKKGKWGQENGDSPHFLANQFKKTFKGNLDRKLKKLLAEGIKNCIFFNIKKRKALMFFFIGGIQPKTVLVDKQAKPCSACGSLNVYLKRVDHYLSLFFIPIFPVKRGIPFLICESCNSTFDQHGYRMETKEKEEERRCSHCGRCIDPDFSFCPYCGKAI